MFRIGMFGEEGNISHRHDWWTKALWHESKEGVEASTM